VTSASGGACVSRAAWSTNRKKSLSVIHLPELAGDSVHGKGYMGHGKFVVAERYLVRSFPAYMVGDPTADTSGGTRQFQYRLEPCEATWQLAVAKAQEFQ